MVSYRNLDDQRYEDIIGDALDRLPWLCEVWTDHNASDPGITILELLAWYKEMQQFYMDRVTPDIYRQLAGMLGKSARHETPASCYIEVSPEGKGYLPYERLTGENGIPFELDEAIPEKKLLPSQISLVKGDHRIPVERLLSDHTPFKPFDFGGGGNSALDIAFAEKPQNQLKLWIDVADFGKRKRNAPDDRTRPPRRLIWSLGGYGDVEPLSDETYSFSFSGAVLLPVPDGWQAAEDGLYHVRATLEEKGCEEEVYLSGISTLRYRARQTESLVRSYSFTLPNRQGAEVTIESAQAVSGVKTCFYREADGWVQIPEFTEQDTDGGVRMTADLSQAAADGEDNFLVVCMEPDCYSSMLYDTTGRPDEQLSLKAAEGQPLCAELLLMCQTLCEDGETALRIWRYTDDITVASPSDEVFTYDYESGIIGFGDGEHGAIPVAGEGSVMVVSLILSRCGEGNVPGGAEMSFAATGESVRNLPASGGRDKETIGELKSRVLTDMSSTEKCVSAADYESCVMRTPGLRVAGAKAIAGYDPTYGMRQKRDATITVVVLPDSTAEAPMPDDRFLSAVARQLERYRQVCVRVRVVGPRFVPVTLSVRCRSSERSAGDEVKSRLREWLAPDASRIGRTLCMREAVSVLAPIEAIEEVTQVSVRTADASGYVDASGDLRLPPDALPLLGDIKVEITN